MNIAVVGSNRGIGLEITRQLTEAGHQVFAFCRKASQELKNLNPTKIIEGFDVTQKNKMSSLLQENDLGKIDRLYHVSGIMRSTSLDNFDHDAIVEQFIVNAVAPIECSKQFLPLLSSDAKIGLVTSRMGSIADNTSGGAYGYRMSKTALNSAGKSLAEDLKERNITVLLLHPGWVKTDMTDHTGHIDAKESAEGLIKLMEEKSIQDTGSFWHTNGEPLPW